MLGEAGCCSRLPVVVNSVLDALTDCGVFSIDMPSTSEMVRRAINRT